MANPVSPTAVAAAAVKEEEEDEWNETSELNPQTIDFLKTCSAHVLAHHLSKHRGCSPSETSVFLKEAYQQAEKAALEMAMSQPTDSSMDFDGGNGNGGMLLEEPLETSLMTPRMGKVSIQLSNGGGFLATRLNMSNSSQQQHLHLPPGSVSHLIVFPKPEDCKLIKAGKLSKVKGHMVLLKLKSPMPFQGNKEIDQVCFGLPWNKNDGCTKPKLVVTANDSDDDGVPGWKQAADAWRKILTEALQQTKNSDSSQDDDNDDEDAAQQTTTMMKVSQVQVNSSVFTSHIEVGTSTTTSGMPFVSCNRGVQDGVLYPLKQGLLFFKPPKFLPVTDMLHVEFSRGRSAGQSSNRYVDFGVVMRDTSASSSSSKEGKKNHHDEMEEFSNILCQEEGPLKEYNDEFILPNLSKETDDDDDEESSSNDKDGKEVEVEAEAVDTEEEDTDADDDDFVEGDESDDDEEEEDGDKTDDDDDEGGIPIVADEMMKELKETAHKRKDELSSNSDTDETQSETEATDENGNPIKRRKSKRLKRQ